MRQCYSTDTVPPEARLDHWRGIVAEHFARFAIECDTIPDERFSGLLTKHTAGPAWLFEIRAAAHAVRGPVQPMKRPGLFVVLQNDGESRMSQNGNTEWLRPGDFIFLDSSRETEAHYAGDMQQSVFSIPLEASPAELEQLLNLAGVRVDGAQGAGRVASHLMQGFIEQADKLEQTQACRLIHSLADVLNTTALSLGEKTARSSSRHQAFHLHRIRLFIEDKLRDPDLTPTKVAVAHGISRRYLSKLFQDEGVSIARYIWERRLDCCRRELADPFSADRSITEIAFSWGFSSASHFSRAFKERFGISPKQAREASAGAGGSRSG